MKPGSVQSAAEDSVIGVRVKPRARTSRVLGEREGLFEVAVAAPPADGRANLELVRVLASALGVPKSSVELVRGGRARVKQVLVRGLASQLVSARLRAAVGSEPGGVETGDKA
jgi:uncharacterized protein (TIGR00251 family)